MMTIAPTPTPPLKGRGLSNRDTSERTNSPPLQGRGRGWGLSPGRLADLADYALQMRREPTEPEKRLWRALSRSQLGGYKVRRQSVIGSAIADFLCPQKGLIVEVDGETHTDPAADAGRTAQLEALGYRVVRVTNLDVMRNLEGVRTLLLDALEALPDRRAPHPNPSPEEGGLKDVEAQKLLGISLEGSVG
jgi:very-short-patch-repair endonuclease